MGKKNKPSEYDELKPKNPYVDDTGLPISPGVEDNANSKIRNAKQRSQSRLHDKKMKNDENYRKAHEDDDLDAGERDYLIGLD